MRGGATIGLALLVLLAAAGCLVRRSTYEAEVARRSALEQELDARDAALAELEHRVADLRKSKETLSLERTSLENERLALIDDIEDVRGGNQTLQRELEQERGLRTKRDAELAEVAGTYGRLVDQLEREVAAGQIEIEELRGRLQVRALEAILFESGSAEIKPVGQEVLGRVAVQLRGLAGYRIQVEGHTDSLPIRSERYPSNWELSAARAVRVLRLLVEQGLDSARTSAVAFGPERPLADNATPEGRARNRRIEIVLLPEGE